VTLLELVTTRHDRLRPSERKVAGAVLANPIGAVDLNIAGLAAAAGVSEPTVVRFCAALGFEGYRAFKIALAQAVALGLPAENASIRRTDSAADLVAKVFQRTISSLDRARHGLDPTAVDLAINQLASASDLLFLGLGASGIVAQDALQRAALFGLPCAAPADAHIQYMAAALAKPGTVVIAISETAGTLETVRSAAAAKRAGAKVVALTGNEGPLSALADIELRSPTFEDTELFTPTVSRLAALVVIDILASGVAMRRPPGEIARLGTAREQLSSVRLGLPSIQSNQEKTQ
jgi:RpiR family carbohydrate utilization transcriptional regulator